MSTYPGSLIAALAVFLAEPPVEGTGWTWYLDLADATVAARNAIRMFGLDLD